MVEVITITCVIPMFHRRACFQKTYFSSETCAKPNQFLLKANNLLSANNNVLQTQKLQLITFLMKTMLNHQANLILLHCKPM